MSAQKKRKHVIALTGQEKLIVEIALSALSKSASLNAIVAETLLQEIRDGERDIAIKADPPADPRDPSGLEDALRTMLAASANLEDGIYATISVGRASLDAGDLSFFAWRAKVMDWLDARAKAGLALVTWLGL